MTENLIFVERDADGRWDVRAVDDPGPISIHRLEPEAERAAIEHARGHGGGYVVVHGRYCRCRVAPEATPTDPSTTAG